MEVSWVEVTESWKKWAIFMWQSASRNADVRICDRLALSSATGHSFWCISTCNYL